MSYVLKKAPCRFLPALHRINLELEANKEGRFRLAVPMTTSNVPGLCLLTDEQKREIAKRIRDCNNAKRHYDNDLKRLHAELRELEAPWKEHGLSPLLLSHFWPEGGWCRLDHGWAALREIGVSHSKELSYSHRNSLLPSARSVSH